MKTLVRNLVLLLALSASIGLTSCRGRVDTSVDYTPVLQLIDEPADMKVITEAYLGYCREHKQIPEFWESFTKSLPDSLQRRGYTTVGSLWFATGLGPPTGSWVYQYERDEHEGTLIRVLYRDLPVCEYRVRDLGNGVIEFERRGAALHVNPDRLFTRAQ